MIRQNRLLGYTWNPEQKKDYEDLYQSWSASDMAAEIVNREILHQSSLAEREQRIATLRTALKHEVDNCVNCSGTGRYVTHREGGYEFIVTCERCAHGRAALAATEGAQYPRAEKETK